MLTQTPAAQGSRLGTSADTPDDDDDDQDIEAGISVAATYSKQTRVTLDCMDQHAINFDIILLLLETLCFGRSDLIPFSSAVLIFLPSLESIRRLSEVLESHRIFGSNSFLILPLHSTISNENQSIVFNVPPPGIRKIVISTFVATLPTFSLDRVDIQ
jgi:ATP-dependent RNA helicase DHX29